MFRSAGHVPRYVAGFDSNWLLLTALARCLHAESAPILQPSFFVTASSTVANAFPMRLRQIFYWMSGWLDATPPSSLRHVDAHEMAQWVGSLYPTRRYDAVMVGATNGAAVHLCAALSIPWLPQSLLVTVRQPNISPDDPRTALRWGRDAADPILARNPDLQVHQLHDPNEDRPMLQHIAYFRLKRTCLGRSYERFLLDRLAPGGTILLMDCRLKHLVTRVSDRHVFQFGGSGALSLEEYFTGSPRVHAFLERQTGRTRWDPPEPDEERPEAEWGLEPALGDDVYEFAMRHGYRVRRIVVDTPDELSCFVADLYRWWYMQREIPSDRLVAGAYTLIDPWWTLRLGLVPFWLKFSVDPCADWLERYLDQSDPYDALYLALFSHGVESIGVTPIARWRAILAKARVEGRFLGVEEKRFPYDLASVIRYHRALTSLPWRYPVTPLPLEHVDQYVDTKGKHYAGIWQ